MKKIIYTRLGLLGLLLLSVAGKAQTLTSCFPNTVDANTTVTLSVTASSSAFLAATGYGPVTTGRIVRTAGGTPITGSWNPTGPSTGTLSLSIPPAALGGAYSISVPNAMGTFFTTTGLLTVVPLPPPPSGQITGRVFFDLNGNGIQDAGELGRSGRVIRFLPSGYCAMSNSLGDYSIWLPLGTYTVTEPFLGYYALSTPSTGSHTVNVAVNGATYGGKNFGNLPSPVVDNYLVSSSISILRPGFNGQINTTVTCNGNVDGTPTEVTVNFPSWLTYLSATPTPIATGPGYATFSVAALSFPGVIHPPGSPPTSRNFTIHVNVPAVTPIGTPVTVTSNLAYPDWNAMDNEVSVTLNVQGSYDPNDKQVFTVTGKNADGFVFPEDSVLRYLIRFQNTGTDTAFLVRIRDTLDLDLDPGAFQVIGASHPYVTTLSKTGHIEFVFNNINLLDSNTSEPASHGWIMYELEFDGGLPPGSIMTNRASIYFDYNAPVLTNTTSTVICAHHVASYTQSSPSTFVRDFTATSVGAVSYQWDFGDGSTSTLPNPSHTYAAAGVYNVCLISTSSCTSDTLCNLITVGCPPAAGAFTHSGLLSHSFTSTSSGSIATYYWTFGDGGTSTLINPTHVYSTPGTYNVCLIVANGCVSDTVCNNIVVTCIPATPSFTHLAGSTGSVSFDNTTSGTFTSHWDFGDGTTSTSTDPTHVYAAGGTYNVCLIMTGMCGSDTTCNTVNVCDWPHANFSSSSSGILTRTFTDLSTGGTVMGRIWTFGDGGTSTSATAAHTYAAPGTYTVCLIVFNSCGNDTLCSNVTVLCTPAVSGFTHSGGLAHSFTNTSTSASSWLWTFGDGGTSTLANPSHTYAAPGTYTACLIASNACDSDTVCTTFTLTCTPGVPSFLFSNLGGGNWFFLNTSGGSATYLWQFGDGGTSTTASPNHTYSSPGTYNVCLIRTDICGSDTTCQTITVCAWTTSLFSHTTSSLTANFTDLSTGGPTTWSWDFGDGSTSTAASPSHTYAAPGTYTVCLTAANTCGGSDTCTTVTVSCVGAPAAGFGWTDVGLGNVSFSNTSTGLPTLASSWDFGDGGTSTAASPTHAYALAGTYVACLTVADGCGSNSTCDTVYVIEGGSNAASPSIFQLSLHPNPTEGVFTVSGQWPDLHGNFTLQVLDATGRLVAESQETALQGEVWAQTDLSGVAAGLYQVRLITAMGNAHLLVMKQ